MYYLFNIYSHSLFSFFSSYTVTQVMMETKMSLYVEDKLVKLRQAMLLFSNSWVWKSKIWIAYVMIVWDWCPASCSPMRVIIIHEFLHVALPRAEDVAVVVVRVGGLWLVVTVVVTPFIFLASLQAAQKAVYWDQVVWCSTFAPAMKYVKSHWWIFVFCVRLSF